MQLHYHLWPRTAVTTEGSSPDHMKHDFSDKPKLLLLHGLGGTGSLWRAIAAGLEEKAWVLAPDQRGHGESQKSIPHSFRPEDFGQDVIDTLTSLNFFPVVGVGHSMGARTLTAAAKIRPDAFSTLVLVDLGLSGLAGGGLGTTLSSFLEKLPNQFPTRESGREFITTNCPDPAIAQYLMAVSIRKPTGELYFPFDHTALLKTLRAAENHSIRDTLLELAEAGKKICLLRGARSQVWSADDFQKEKSNFSRFPSVQFIEFENAGHGLPFEQRVLFTDLLLSLMGLS